MTVLGCFSRNHSAVVGFPLVWGGLGCSFQGAFLNGYHLGVCSTLSPCGECRPRSFWGTHFFVGAVSILNPSSNTLAGSPRVLESHFPNEGSVERLEELEQPLWACFRSSLGLQEKLNAITHWRGSLISRQTHSQCHVSPPPPPKPHKPQSHR